ncbi:hypothetical protein PVAP13_1KG215415 [Panicum virgatum]|uniref:Uncharacterized protein n=1 Tax=Panicum virgatum TaxID=38727 RepID=A0A8T0XK58_PANVG|nr:hypothetical protein PVAP13_1KG215415 [Panicum virgatum]
MREYETQCTCSSSMQMLMNMRPSAVYKDSSKKTNAYILKTYKQKVHFSAKDVLDYVVKYFGLKSVDLEEKDASFLLA